MNTWIDDSSLTSQEKLDTKNSYLLLLEMEKLALGVFDDFELVDLAKTGDSDQKQLTFEGTLVVKNHNAHGMLLGIDPVASVVSKG
jgi:hypothetical protein